MQKPKQKPDTLSNKYQRTLELSFIITLLILSSLFFSFQKHQTTFKLPEVDLDDIVIEVIPPTKQPPKKPPQPPRPSVLVPDDELTEMQEDEPEDIFKIDPTLEVGPPPEEDIVYEFYGVQEKPKMKYFEIPKYPELARKAGIEGKITVNVIISEDGTVISAVFYNGDEIFKDAALEAAIKCIFYPAKQNERYVKVKMAIPFEFRLN